MPISDGLGFEEVNQNVTFTEIISGTMIYAYSGVSTPLMSTTRINPVTSSGTLVMGTTISGTNAYISTKITSTTFSGTNIVGTNISGNTLTNSQGAVRSVRQGASYGAFVQAGSGTLGGGSSWLSFPVAFTSTPQFVLANCNQPVTDIAQTVIAFAGSNNPGSAYIIGSAANTFNWIAVGL